MTADEALYYEVQELRDQLKQRDETIKQLREALREILPLADGMVFEMYATVDDNVIEEAKAIMNNARKLIDLNKPEK